ncbi:DUF1697 domain-containing protein [Chryseobacterium sp. MP_3.2]|uniref:DUF1697 domain-containing protein n=1 Tax=Chryseobacterium sp. MP_3.2 TaxID=3071712 RepID=UPI002DFC3AB7|nr:uncharacterized protein (DUF1697 family) [Chryseobacterium sp. MP_3.2]
MRYCAFLRGVNVNSTSMKMADVCKVVESVGIKEVSAVLATGNILFSSEENTTFLKEKLQKALSVAFNYEAFLFLKYEEEVRNIVEHCPFEKTTESHIYIFLGNAGIEIELLNQFSSCLNISTGEDAQISHNYFYWKVPKGNTLNSEFGKILGKKSFKDQFTSRNINTLEKVLKKL